jgi:hypothetical protein
MSRPGHLFAVLGFNEQMAATGPDILIYVPQAQNDLPLQERLFEELSLELILGW